jgi:hypothetical protein
LIGYVDPELISAAVRFFTDKQHKLPPALFELSRAQHSTRARVVAHVVTYGPDGEYDGALSPIENVEALSP